MMPGRRNGDCCGDGGFFQTQMQLGLCLCPISVLGEEVEELGYRGGRGVDHEARMETSHHGSGHCWEELALTLVCLQPGPALLEADAECLPALLQALLQNQLLESGHKRAGWMGSRFRRCQWYSLENAILLSTSL